MTGGVWGFLGFCSSFNEYGWCMERLNFQSCVFSLNTVTLHGEGTRHSWHDLAGLNHKCSKIGFQKPIPDLAQTVKSCPSISWERTGQRGLIRRPCSKKYLLSLPREFGWGGQVICSSNDLSFLGKEHMEWKCTRCFWCPHKSFTQVKASRTLHAWTKWRTFCPISRIPVLIS